MKLPLSDYDSAFEAACAAIEAGGVVAYPTDTLYGIGCDATRKEAVDRVRSLKLRDGKKPLSIIVFDLSMLKKYCVVGKDQERILHALLPGPYTFILPLTLPLPVCEGKNVGVRVPDHIFMRDVSRKTGVPIVSTSANLSGGASPAEPAAIPDEILQGTDLLIDGGKCPHAEGSTIIDLIEMKIIRKGAVRKGDRFEWEAGKE